MKIYNSSAATDASAVIAACSIVSLGAIKIHSTVKLPAGTERAVGLVLEREMTTGATELQKVMAGHFK